MENRLLNRKEAIEELHRGRELANQLLEVVHKWNGDEGSTSLAEDLVQKILRSLTNTLLFFRDSSCPNSEDMEENCNGTLTLKNRRGCYKRRRTLQTWEKDIPSLIDDGHTWRKYGQKLTLNAKYPRNYYRCTHKYDQGCQAIKQVQRIQENPPLYRTTYYGHHTCKILLNPEMILEPASPSDSSILLSFNQA